MRIGLSSSSEASEDEGTASSFRHRSMPTKDLRTAAGKAGAANFDYDHGNLPVLTSSTLQRYGTSTTSAYDPQQDRQRKQQQNGSPAAARSCSKRGADIILPPWLKPRSRVSTAPIIEGQSDGESSSSSVSSSKRTALRSNRPSGRRSIIRVDESSRRQNRSYQSTPPSSSEDEVQDAPETSHPDTSDSEELQWPVGPQRVGRGGSRGLRRLSNAANPKGRDRETAHSIRLAAEEDEWEADWTDAVRRTSKRWASMAYRQSESSFESPSSRVATAADEARPLQVEEDVSIVRSTLNRLSVEKDQLDRRERQQFEEREKKLWGSIEGAIKAAEDEARRKAKEEEQRLADARRAQEEADRKAKAAKEEEENMKRREKEAIEKQREDAEAKKKDEERLQQVTQQKKAAEAKQKEASKAMDVGDALHDQAKAEYRRWSETMKHIKEKVLPVVSENAQWRKQCFAAKRQITPKIGQLTNSSGEIWRITSTISGLLKEARAAPCPDHEIYQWVLNHLCKCLIRQAEQEVAVKIDTAFPLARVVLWLLLDGHDRLGEILMARLVKKSCWCLGYVPEKGIDQDNAAYSKAVGRASPEETSVQFASRQSGIVAFYFAICQTPPEPAPSQPAADLSLVPPHFRPAALWVWQARCVTPPMTLHAIVPALWSTLLEVAGARLLEYYGRQTIKVWQLLYSQGIMEGKARFVQLEEGKAASGRLQLLLEDWKKTGGVRSLKGREMEA